MSECLLVRSGKLREAEEAPSASNIASTSRSAPVRYGWSAPRVSRWAWSHWSAPYSSPPAWTWIWSRWRRWRARPSCKLMDFGKFKYESALKAREARRNQQQTVIKEMKLRPKIDPHDYETKKGHVDAVPRRRATRSR